jgi:DNA-binding MarR family transcriptional regulator
VSADVKFSTLIHEISLLVSRSFNRRVKEMGLTRSQWMVLYWLYSDGVQSQTELAEKLSIAKQPLGKVIDRLEQDGWLVRNQNPEDKRQKLVSVTNKIQPFIKPLSEVVDGIDKLALISLPPNDQISLMEDLLQIRAHLKSDLG